MTQTWIWQSLHEERFIDFSVWLLYREDVRLFIVVEERDTQTHTLGVTNSNVSLLYCIVLWHIMQRLPDRELEWLWLKCILCFPRLCLSIELQLFLFFFFFFPKDTMCQRNACCSVRLDTAVTAQQYFPSCFRTNYQQHDIRGLSVHLDPPLCSRCGLSRWGGVVKELFFLKTTCL